jgi:pSer/pThr/pTyr-binding forkhead associated (FHA) protein
MIKTKLDFKLKNTTSGQEFRIDKDTLSIGRDPSCDIVLNQGYPSRTHAQIIFKNNTLFLDDLMSTNGTFVNNQRINNTTRIVPGDLIKFSTVEFSLSSSTFGDETIISKAPTFSKIDDSFVVQDEIIKVDPNSTGVLQSYPLPFGWPVDDTVSKQLFQNKPDKKHLNKLDQLIKKELSGDDTVYSAALVFNPKDEMPSVFGLSLGSQQDTLSIGRNDHCTITIKAPSISEHHANLHFEKSRWVLTDHNSTNGLRSQGRLISELVLEHSGTVSLGQIEMTFRKIPWAL